MVDLFALDDTILGLGDAALKSLDDVTHRRITGKALNLMHRLEQADSD